MWQTHFETIFQIAPQSNHYAIDFVLPFVLSLVLIGPVYEGISKLYGHKPNTLKRFKSAFHVLYKAGFIWLVIWGFNYVRSQWNALALAGMVAFLLMLLAYFDYRINVN